MPELRIFPDFLRYKNYVRSPYISYALMQTSKKKNVLIMPQSSLRGRQSHKEKVGRKKDC